MIVQEVYFRWFVVAMVWAIGLGWALRDLIAIIKHWSKRREMHDEFFGYIMGVILGSAGVIGAIKYHLNL